MSSSRGGEEGGPGGGGRGVPGSTPPYTLTHVHGFTCCVRTPAAQCVRVCVYFGNTLLFFFCGFQIFLMMYFGTLSFFFFS